MLQPLDFGQLQLRLDGRDDAFGEPVLKVEHVTHIAFEPIGPDMPPRCRVDELSGKAKTIAPAAYAALQYVATAEFTSSLADIDGFALVGERRVPRDDEQPGTT